MRGNEVSSLILVAITALGGGLVGHVDGGVNNDSEVNKFAAKGKSVVTDQMQNKVCRKLSEGLGIASLERCWCGWCLFFFFFKCICSIEQQGSCGSHLSLPKRSVAALKVLA